MFKGARSRRPSRGAARCRRGLAARRNGPAPELAAGVADFDRSPWNRGGSGRRAVARRPSPRRVYVLFKGFQNIIHCFVWAGGEADGRGNYFEQAFLKRSPAALLVAPLEPFETSERMTIQQGLFLAASSFAFSFERILASTLQDANAVKGCIHRIRICPEARLHLLYLLEKTNITEATLFPGIDGFARSLRTTVELPGKVRDGISAIMLGETQPQPWRS